MIWNVSSTRADATQNAGCSPRGMGDRPEDPRESSIPTSIRRRFTVAATGRRRDTTTRRSIDDASARLGTLDGMKRLVPALLGWGSIGMLAWLASGCGANDAGGSKGPPVTPEG